MVNFKCNLFTQLRHDKLSTVNVKQKIKNERNGKQRKLRINHNSGKNGLNKLRNGLNNSNKKAACGIKLSCFSAAFEKELKRWK